MERLLEKFEVMCGLNIQWKAVGTGKTSCGLSERHTYHQCTFCRKVKATPELLYLCSKNDDLLLPQRAEAEKKPFISTCHAGVSELVIPFFDNGRCRELLLAGIFRERNASTPCAFLKKDFRALPLWNREKQMPVLEFLAELAAVLREQKRAALQSGATAGTGDLRILRAITRIERELAGKIRMKDLARTACLSESRFLHLFRQETGLSAVAFITRCRLNAARQMLETSGISIQEVMEHCGFRDQSRFGKLFREFTGYTPLVYHKKFRRKKDV